MLFESEMSSLNVYFNLKQNINYYQLLLNLLQFLKTDYSFFKYLECLEVNGSSICLKP